MKNSENKFSQRLEVYTSLVVKGLLNQFDTKIKKHVGLDEKSMAKMIDGKYNEHGEYEPNYPDHFEYAVDELWECGKSVQQAIEYFGDGVSRLVYTQAVAM